MGTRARQRVYQAHTLDKGVVSIEVEVLNGVHPDSLPTLTLPFDPRQQP